jgi:hypothetical protein
MQEWMNVFLAPHGALLRLLTVPFLPLLLAGCQGGGRVEVTSLNFREIDPPAPHFVHVPIDRCYWWTDDQDQVWIAMERDQPLLVRPEHFVFQLSLVLEKLPAGRGRDYHVFRRELRGKARFGPAEGRYVSLSGIVALYREGTERLRGSFRLEVAQEALGLLGWSAPRRQLMMGTFEAVPDNGRGRTIAAQTEADGWQRTPPAQGPATEPGATRSDGT